MTRSITKLVVTLCFGIVSAYATAAPEPEPDEQASSTAELVLKIAKFVSWPNSRETPSMRFCIVGSNSVLGALQAMSDRLVHGRSIRAISAPTPAQVSLHCDVLYFADDPQRPATEWTQFLTSQPVLTFAEAGQYGSVESIVTFIFSQDKTQFEINLTANRQTGLAISARLMQLTAVTTREGGE